MLKHLRGKRIGQGGDTLVEVLIAIAVVSLILGGAYVTTNHSLQAARDSQERGNGLKLVESQLEQLKSAMANDSTTVMSAAQPFCMTGPTTTVSASGSNCYFDTSGAANPAQTQPAYHLTITHVGNLFTVKNQWPNVAGGSTDNISMKYRVY